MPSCKVLTLLIESKHGIGTLKDTAFPLEYLGGEINHHYNRGKSK